MKDKGDAGNSFQQRLSAPPTDKGVYSSRGSISPGNWGQLLFVCIASPSLGQATISLAHHGVSLVSFITIAGSHRGHIRRAQSRAQAAASRGMLIITRQQRRNAPLPPAVHSPHFTEVKNRPKPPSPPDLVFLQLAPWAVRRTIPSLRCTHKWA